MKLPEAARYVVEQLPDTKIVAVSFGSPYVVRDLPSLRTYLCAYGTQPLLQLAAVRALYGERPISGKLPVTLR
jgi:beta-N-acetylhexosaminidase